ncbi:hypothetical protein [Legionella waltersii]|uniref:Transmembrane protein n=1 Tax=Legionella waltersii TaxID=66969 RepID=A0A0W1AP10_9GAMM|nr:hypothetical protein [Legionella waltersii]KTD83063.1 hypothetical protein Lwal_0051 [Legionella waltersii]SNV08194.1 Uncharacterised protein [Legionella waltersii]
MLTKKDTWILNLTGLIVSIVTIFVLWRQFYIFVDFTLLFGFLFTLSYNGQNNLRLLGSSLFIALILSLPGLWISNPIKPGFFYFLVYCFHYTYHRSGNLWHMNYRLLFEAAWNGILVLLVAVLFLLASAVLIFCASFLFSSQGSPFVFNLIYTNTGRLFQLFLTWLLLFIGIGVAQYHIKTLCQLRFILLMSMYYLLPILVIISSVVLILLWNIDLNPNAIITVFFELTLLGILFLNAYYQDGSDEIKRLVWLNWLLRGYKVLLLLMILIANYYAFRYVSIELSQLIYLTILLFLGWFYAYSAFFSDERAQNVVENGNKCFAIVFIAAFYFVIASPFNFTVNKEKAPLSLWHGADSIGKNGAQ